MTGIFKANNPLNTFLLFFYGLILKMGWFLSPQIPFIQQSDGFLFNNALRSVKPFMDHYPISYSIITYLLLFSQAISINHFMMRRRSLIKPTYLPGMSYLLITSFFPEWNILSAPLLVNTFLIWAWAKMSNLYNAKHAKSTLFNIGIVIAFCSFLYFPSIAFVVLILFSLIITRPFKASEWIIALLGIAVSWYFLFAWLFLRDKIYSFSLPGFKLSYPIFAQNNEGYAAMISLLVLAIIGSFFIQTNSGKQIVQVRKSWTLMLVYFLVALLIPFISPVNNFEYWILATVPAAAFISEVFFYPNKKWMPLILHWLMVAFIIYMQYFKK